MYISMSQKFLLDDTCSTNNNTFNLKLLKCWKDLRSARKTFCCISDDEKYLDTLKKYTEDEFSKVIDVTLNHLMLSPKITLINSDEILVYYFFKSLLTWYDNGESEKDVSIDENERNNLALHTFKKIFCTQFFLKIGCILDTILEKASKATRTFPICRICISIGLISDVLRNNSSTLLLLYHLGELWDKLGTIIKELVKHIVSANMYFMISDFENMYLKERFPSHCVLLDVLHVCLVKCFTIYSKFPVDMSSSAWPVYFVRGLRTVHKLVHKSDHLSIITLYPNVNKLVYELLCSYSRSTMSNINVSDSKEFYGCLTAHIVHTIKARKIKRSNEISLLEPDTSTSLRIIIICGLETVLKLNPNDLQLWSMINSIRELLLEIELEESHEDHSYESSIITLFSEDDGQLFRVLDLWIQIENRIKSTELHLQTTLSTIPNAHWLFAYLAKSIGFSPYLFVDWLVSPETTCLSYLIHYLRRLSTEDETTCNPNQLVKSTIPMDSWPLQSLMNMLSQIGKSLENLNRHKGIAFCPKPLINLINRSLSVLNNVCRAMGQL
ncbi:hypothetical protein KSF78_0001081 [Schistosoma japonicum]|nr:hypothetical protein KSF78_0001078 [Schistosoma japonicum]KAH8852231.1 hypothetical protein KSF78_0001078 [Schistosoma japonicum]KAH8852233.1 hypothetical protein KSF78_0001078 [Schistosoma japonicum]KAH8852234.1 hypothetical protein KSF78_0001078 [Schistosoma japonicum]KAH8852239.1 hypothetical protein KSF78_0001081 [Schistosoma japonicum]